MLADLGTASLAAGLLTAPLAALLWLRVALAGPAARPARLASAAALLAAATAVVALETALLTHDFSVRFVAENGGRHVPVYYTVTSLWSAMDGSLLLWLLVLAAYAALLARGRPDRLRAYAMVVVSVVTTFFFALSVFAANPFRAVTPAPADGPGPNPLLQQHPAMGVHPPLLYAGYLGTVVPFALALAAPLAGPAGRRWLRVARPWALVSWCTLTAGIVLGAWWSYAVLGWGGYWAWDPVENASLLPWLTTTAFLHTTLGGGRGRERWNSVLACAGFLLVLLGTFLTRSGAVASVHAFTDSPLGPLLLGFVLLAVLTATVLTGRPRTAPAPAPASPLRSRGTAVLGNAALLLTIAATVLTGTVLPLLAEPVTGSRAAVGAGYYHRTAVPLAVLVLLLAGVTPALRVRGRAEALRRLVLPGAAGLATVACVGLSSRPGTAALTGFGAAAFVLAGLATARPLLRPAVLGHAGLALLALGVAASTAYGRAEERTLRVGETLRVSDVSVRLVSVQRSAPAGRMAVRARLAVSSAGTTRTAVPALRYDPARETAVTVPAIDGGVRRDVYLTLLAVSADSGTATVRLAVNPLVGVIWAGGAVATAGGVLALARAVRRHRHRRPEPAGARTAVAAGAPA
ncbi:cytochrome c-type biogenesis protein CcmF [Micromonospora pattaloongensis]|uniref:Cytochrome c-type biogenesis protein CcmF n=1 Tax=Micromonospora pattaloongensis TaxID=405436 RepID=A0A1H3R5Z9_9ACTN|nr:cytochrome c biogenesis protein CcsA [Micromonospora pattaloongensis]SDZ20648.1 cytochrome c-type biogenesis protein CcmF [Micromonospora pattaloongensis]